MNVQELINELEKQPKNAKVAVYCQISEDSDMASKVKFLNEEEGPYNKLDNIWSIYGIPEDEKIVFIM